MTSEDLLKVALAVIPIVFGGGGIIAWRMVPSNQRNATIQGQQMLDGLRQDAIDDLRTQLKAERSRGDQWRTRALAGERQLRSLGHEPLFAGGADPDGLI